MTTAEAIGVAPEAVTQYRLRARAKLGLDSTTQLAGFAGQCDEFGRAGVDQLFGRDHVHRRTEWSKLQADANRLF